MKTCLEKGRRLREVTLPDIEEERNANHNV